MLMKSFFHKPAVDDQEYAIKLRARRKGSVLSLLLGIATVAAAIFWVQNTISSQMVFLSGLFTGLGSVMIVASIITIVKISRLFKDERKLHQQRLKEGDERIHTIARQAGFVAGTVVILAEYLALLVSGFFNLTVFWTLWAAVIFHSGLIAVLTKYYKKKM